MQLSYDADGQCMVSVRVSGQKSAEFDMMVDTGARYVHLDDKKCKELKLTPYGGVRIKCIHGFVDSLPRYKGHIRIEGVPYGENDRQIVGCILSNSHPKVTSGVSQPEEKEAVVSFTPILGREVLAKLKFISDMKKSEASLEQSL